MLQESNILFWLGVFGLPATWVAGKVAEAEVVRWLCEHVDGYVDQGDSARRDSTYNRTRTVPIWNLIAMTGIAVRDSRQYVQLRAQRGESQFWGLAWRVCMVAKVMFFVMLLVGVYNLPVHGR